MTASSVSPPAFMTWTALAQALTPPLLRLALEMAMNLGRDWALAMRIIGNAAAPRMAARRLKAMLMCGPSSREKDIMSQVVGVGRPSADWRMCRINGIRALTCYHYAPEQPGYSQARSRNHGSAFPL